MSNGDAWVELGPIYDTLRTFDHRWTLEILAALTESPRRFNALQREIGDVNSKTQRDALRRLVERGLVRRPEDGDGVHYVLTPLGERALPALEAFVKELSDWQDARDSGERSHQS